MKSKGFQIVDFPKSRVATFDVGKIGLKKHHIAGFLEIDVTDARARLKQLKASKHKVSFFAWVLKVIADTIVEYPAIQAINLRGRKQVLFDDVDISIPVEREVDGVKVPLATVIRAVNRKSVEEIYAEIQAAQRKPIDTEGDLVLAERKNQRMTGLFFSMPQWLRMLVWKFILRNPFSQKENMGTVIVTTIAGAGKFPGWILPRSMHNLNCSVGSIVKKPWVASGSIEIREILYLTVIFNHDVIDGAPAARFTTKLVHNLEHAHMQGD